MKQEEKQGREDFPSQNNLTSKTLTLTEQQGFEIEAMSGLMKHNGYSISQSDIVRMCLSHSLEDVKMRLCRAIGLDDCPSFHSK
jgi:hypothetical protein